MLEGEEDETIQPVFMQLGDNLAEAVGTPPNEWGPEVVTTILEQYSQAIADADGLREEVRTNMAFVIVRLVFDYLGRTQRLNMTRNELETIDNIVDASLPPVSEAMLDAVGAQSAENVTPSVADVIINRDPRLPEWDQAVEEQSLAEVADWLNQYLRVTGVERFHDTGEHRELLLSLMTALAQMLYRNDRETPDAWTLDALSPALTILIKPYLRAVDENDHDDFFAELVSLFLFVEGARFIEPGRAMDYSTIVTHVADHFGLTIDADNLPLTLVDADEVDEDEGTFEAESFLAITPAEGQEILADPVASQQFVSIFENAGLTLLPEHVEAVGSRQWAKKTAVTLHHQAILVGLQLWWERDGRGLWADVAFEDLLITTVMFIDEFYAKKVLPPKLWDAAHIRQWAQDLKDEGVPLTESDRRYFTAVFDVMAAQNILSRVQADALKQALPASPRAPKSKVVPFPPRKKKGEK